MVSSLWPRLRVRCWVSPWPSPGENVVDCFSHHDDCLRYFAAQYGLAGRTNLEMAQADEIVDAVNDMINKRIAARNETDERKKSTMTREVMSETIPATLVSL